MARPPLTLDTTDLAARDLRAAATDARDLARRYPLGDRGALGRAGRQLLAIAGALEAAGYAAAREQPYAAVLVARCLATVGEARAFAGVATERAHYLAARSPGASDVWRRVRACVRGAVAERLHEAGRAA